MTLKARLQADAIVNLKAGNKVATTTLRNLVGEINTKEKGGKTPVELTDAQVTTLLQKEASRRRETAVTYTNAGHQDRAAAEIAEAEIIEAYLPQALTEAEVAHIIEQAFVTVQEANGTVETKHMGSIMKLVTTEVAGRFDGKTVSTLVRTRLA